jgi:cytochrome c peroxidase
VGIRRRRATPVASRALQAVAGAGQVVKFDDLPAAYRGNVNTTEVPYDRRPGDAPALSDAEVDDVVAFLRTLTDGYRR